MSEEQTLETSEQAVTTDMVVEEVEEVEVQPVETEEESATPEESEKPKRKSRAEDRINALTREKYEAQRQAEQYQRRLADIEEAIRSQQPPPDVRNMPKLSDYDYDENRYQQAIAQWNMQQREGWQAEQQAQQQYQQQMIAAEREQAIVQQKAAEGIAKYDDFREKVFDPNLPSLGSVSPAAYQAMLESDMTADVAYYLASNPGEVYAFASMNPIQAVRKVAQIEASIKAKPATKTVPPKPPTRVQGNSEAVKDPEKMPIDEWLTWRNNQLQSKR